MAKKNLIIDTNVLLSDSDCFEKFENNDLFVPIKVLEELDNHKTPLASMLVNPSNDLMP